MRSGQFNFSKGEIGEELIARVDVQSYSSAAKQARNVIVLKYGGLAKRPGTHFIAEAYNASYPVKLIPFQFSLTQAYALELGQYYMRPAAFGGLVLEDLLKVTAITKATNAKITAAYHAYSIGDQVYFQKITGMVQINGLTGTVVSVVDANNFTVNINSTSFSTFTGSDGIVRSAPPPPPPPPPPPSPLPPPPPAAPDTGGGGGYIDEDPTRPCVSLESLFLMADGSEKPGYELRVGDVLRTYHEITLELGAYAVLKIGLAEEDIFSLPGYPDASAPHRFAWPLWIARHLPPDMRWFRMRWFGRKVRKGIVIRVLTGEAHTYMARHPSGSKWRLCHNWKPDTL